MNMLMSAPARREIIEALRQRYAAATRDEKSRILSEFTAVSGLHRKSAIRVLNAEIDLTKQKRRGRPRLYDQAVQQALISLWEASDRICGKRLKPLLPVLLAALERHGHIAMDSEIKDRLLALSPATIDRLLASTRAVACGRRKRRAPSGPRRKMPLRTFAEWGEARVGEMEMDLVAHCGTTNAGSYVSTLVLTDVISGWTECAPIVVRSRELVAETVERLRQSLPFPLVSLDTDNGTEFVNEVLVDYCTKRGIGLTRSRPYLKNDQAWVEQKNGSVVRRMVGYARLEGIGAARALSRLYTSARLFVNFFQPSFKLAAKHRDGSRIVKRYHAPATPTARLMESSTITDEIKARLRDTAEKLDPLALLDEIRAMQHHLAALAKGERMHTPAERNTDLAEFLARFCNGQLRTLQRRLADWRLAASHRLVFRDLNLESVPEPEKENPPPPGPPEVEGRG